MTKFDAMEQNFVALTDEELMNVDGGSLLAATIGGIAVWKLGVAALGGLGVGYLVNR